MAFAEIIGAFSLVGFPAAGETLPEAPVVQESIVGVNEFAVLPEALVIVGLDKFLLEPIKNRPNRPANPGRR